MCDFQVASAAQANSVTLLNMHRRRAATENNGKHCSMLSKRARPLVENPKGMLCLKRRKFRLLLLLACLYCLFGLPTVLQFYFSRTFRQTWKQSVMNLRSSLETSWNNYSYSTFFRSNSMKHILSDRSKARNSHLPGLQQRIAVMDKKVNKTL